MQSLTDRRTFLTTLTAGILAGTHYPPRTEVHALSNCILNARLSVMALEDDSRSGGSARLRGNRITGRGGRNGPHQGARTLGITACCNEEDSRRPGHRRFGSRFIRDDARNRRCPREGTRRGTTVHRPRARDGREVRSRVWRSHAARRAARGRARPSGRRFSAALLACRPGWRDRY